MIIGIDLRAFIPNEEALKITLMNLELVTTKEMSEAINSLMASTDHLTSQCVRKSDKSLSSYVNKLRKATDEVEKLRKHAQYSVKKRIESYQAGIHSDWLRKPRSDYSYSLWMVTSWKHTSKIYRGNIERRDWPPTQERR